MGMARRDKTWPAPRSTRHVWVVPTSRQGQPVQGYVVAWARHAYRWRAQVVWVETSSDGGEQLVQRWLPAERLRPVRTDPNVVISYSWFSELGRPRS